MFTVVLGALLMTVPTYVQAYGNGDVAGLLKRGAVSHCDIDGGRTSGDFTKCLSHWGMVQISSKLSLRYQ
jgi:hypothetical protein